MLVFPAPAAAQCRLCPPGGQGPRAPSTPISLAVEARLDFSRIGLVTANQGGRATIDPATGQRTITGALIPLSGIPFTGSVSIRGEPNERVIVTFPSQVTLSTTGGGTLLLRNFTTALRNNPRLERDGTLTFTFGGELLVDGRSDGDFRGTVPITVEYR
jgi:hypothetical protein